MSAEDGPVLVTGGSLHPTHRVWIEVVVAGERPTVEGALAGATALYTIVEGLTATRLSRFREAVTSRTYFGLVFAHAAALDWPQRARRSPTWPVDVPDPLASPRHAIGDGRDDGDCHTPASWQWWLLPAPGGRTWQTTLDTFQPTLVLTLEDWSVGAAGRALTGAGLRLVETFGVPADQHDLLTALSPSLPRRNWRRRRLFGERWLADQPQALLGAAVEQYVQRMGYPVFGEPYSSWMRQWGGPTATIELAPGRYIPTAGVRRVGVPARTEEGLHAHGANGLAIQVFGGRPVAARVGALVAAVEGALVHTLGLVAEEA